MTGYNLKMMYDQERDELDLTRLIAGSEGTLGVVRRAKVKLTPLPTSRRLIVFGYARFQDACTALGGWAGWVLFCCSRRPLNAIERVREAVRYGCL
mgnify:CR=1 FL=1